MMRRFHPLRTLLIGTGLVAAAAPAGGQVILPLEGATLQRTHVEFRWAPVDGAQTYELEVVVDAGDPDPFAGAAPVVDLVTADASVSNIVTGGLAFDAPYAWRVRGLDPAPRAWGPTHRFTIAPIPGYIPPMTVTSGAGTPEPGITMFNIFAFNPLPTGVAVGIDLAGEPVWFITAEGRLGDLRLLDNGRVLYAAGGRGYEATLDGQITWASPDDPDLEVHHEIHPMPNGNFMALLYEFFEVEVDGQVQTWMGDWIVEFDRHTNEIVWEWKTSDHYSVLDFDEVIMQNPQNDGTYDWTHANAVVYNPLDGDVYISVRHLNRITRIDYDTGAIVYNMGFTSPSGDDDFGDNLFSFQHAPQLLPNGNMMVYDNGNRRDHLVHDPQTGVSKAIELAFTNGKDGLPIDAAIVWEYTSPSYTPFIGDADRLPGGNTLVTAGAAAKIIEVAPDGTEVWDLSLLDLGNYLIYRSERVAELVIPAACDCPGDLDCSQFIALDDFYGVLDAWGDCPDGVDCRADVDGDGTVGILDVLELLANWGACP